MSNENRRPSTGAGSRRYQRYEDAGTDIVGSPVDQESERAKRNAEPQSGELTAAEQQRLNDQRYRGLNQGTPLHRGADEKTYEATVRGLHGGDRTEDELTEEQRTREYDKTNSGTPVTHKGFSDEDKARLEADAQSDLDKE